MKSGTPFVTNVVPAFIHLRRAYGGQAKQGYPNSGKIVVIMSETNRYTTMNFPSPVRFSSRIPTLRPILSGFVIAVAAAAFSGSIPAVLAQAESRAETKAPKVKPNAKSKKASSAGAEVRLNRVIELLDSGKPAYGAWVKDVSLRSGASAGKNDFVLLDLEHSPYDVTQLQAYLFGMIDKRAIVEKGNLQMGVVPIVRVPSAGREQALWVIKQVLDLGVFGLLIPHVDTAADALAAVRATRFPQLRNAPDYEPQGLRGIGYGWPARYWGLSGSEYAQRADVWPLDPKGEILLWLMIETRDAVKNCRAIAKTPGVSGLFVGPSDLAFSMGVPLGDPEVEVALQQVLAIAKEEGVLCGTVTGGPADVQKRLQQGFRFLTR